jgi:hypothetical protein
MAPIQLEDSLDILKKKNISCTFQGSNSNHPACSLVAAPAAVSRLRRIGIPGKNFRTAKLFLLTLTNNLVLQSDAAHS